MLGNSLRGIYRLVIVTLVAVSGASAASPDTNVYALRGPGAGITWRAGDGSGTEVLLFAFSNLVPQQGAVPPGPRATFSITRMAVEGGTLVRRQWYGDYPLEPNALAIGPGLGEAVLDTIVGGTLVEQRGNDVSVRRDTPARLQIRWTATGPAFDNTAVYVQQAPLYSVSLQAVGASRLANVTATFTVAFMGEPLTVSVPGGLLSPTSGLLTTTMQ